MKICILFLQLLLTGVIHAQPRLQSTEISQSDFSSARLVRIDKLQQQYVDSGWIAGSVALIAKNGKIAYHKAVGYDDIDKKTPLKKDAIFRIASQTKAITSTAVLMLYEEGRFLLDDPVSKYIPEFRNPKVVSKLNLEDTSYTVTPARGEITIRHLLTHTSGIDYPMIGSDNMKAIYAKHDIPTGIAPGHRVLATEMKKLAALPLAHHPGEKWTYGLNTDVLGYLVEVVSGMTLDRFFRTKIFEPLGMVDTYFNLPPEKHHRLAVLYTEDSLHKLMKYRSDENNDNYPVTGSAFFSGGAGLSSTALDYAIFLQMLLNGGIYNGKRILSPATVRMMTMNQIGDLNLGNRKFGLGFGIATEKTAASEPASEGSFEWGGYFGTMYWVDPKEKLIGMIMTQEVPNSEGDIFAKFRVLTYGAIGK